MARLVRVENRTTDVLDVTLNDGTNLHCGIPFKGSTEHISNVVDYSNLPAYMTKKGGMIARGEAKIIEAGGAL